MSTEKWSAFAAATGIAAADELVGLQGGVNKRFPQSVIGGGILQRTVPLNNDQIIHLPTTGVDVIPAPGVGKGNLILLAMVSFNSVAGAYTNVDVTSTVYLVNDAAGDFDQVTLGAQPSSFFASQPGAFTVLTPFVGSGIPITAPVFSKQFSNWNTPTQIWANNGAFGDYTGGDPANTLKVTVFYAVVDL